MDRCERSSFSLSTPLSRCKTTERWGVFFCVEMQWCAIFVRWWSRFCHRRCGTSGPRPCQWPLPGVPEAFGSGVSGSAMVIARGSAPLKERPFHAWLLRGIMIYAHEYACAWVNLFKVEFAHLFHFFSPRSHRTFEAARLTLFSLYFLLLARASAKGRAALSQSSSYSALGVTCA